MGTFIQAQATPLRRSCFDGADKQIDKNRSSGRFQCSTVVCPVGKVCVATGGAKGREGLDISIVVVVFFPHFYFILFFCFLFWFPLTRKRVTDRSWDLFFRASWPTVPVTRTSLPSHTTTPRDSYFAVKRTAGARAFVARVAFERFVLTASGVILQTLRHRRWFDSVCVYFVNTRRHKGGGHALLSWGQVPRLNYFHSSIPLYDFNVSNFRFHLSDGDAATA